MNTDDLRDGSDRVRADARRGPRERLAEAYELLERMGKKAERGLTEARRFDHDVLMPVSMVLVPSFSAVALRDTQIYAGGKGAGAAWLKAKEEAQHYDHVGIVEAAFDVTLTWGKALAYVATGKKVRHQELMSLLAEAEREMDAGLTMLETKIAEKSHDHGGIGPGPRRIKDIVEDTEGAEHLLRDLFYYLAEERNLGDVLVENVLRWDHEYAHESGESWYSDPDEVFIEMIAALKRDFESRQDQDDEAWEYVLDRADEVNRQRREDPANPS